MSAIRDGHVPVRVATWGLGRRFARFLPALVRMRAEGQVELVGATAAQLPPGAAVEGIPVLPREELVQQDFDLLLLMVADAEPLVQEVAERWGVPRAKVASSDLLRFPGLDLRRWLQLRQTPPSIVAADAWGARACQSLQIPCRSPFQGALVRDADFLRLAADLPGHLAQPLELDYVRVDDAGRAGQRSAALPGSRSCRSTRAAGDVGSPDGGLYLGKRAARASHGEQRVGRGVCGARSAVA